MIAAAFVSDRGPLYLPGCVESFEAQPEARLVTARTVIDDSNHELGMAGAVQAAWEWALDEGCDYLLHIEEDFRFYDLPISGMIAVLSMNPHLTHVVLKRDPWSAEEHMAGGQIETNPTAHTECGGAIYQWVEHDLLFSLNPCVIPRRTLELGMPASNERGFEAEFAAICRTNGLRFAYYGRRYDKPRCYHVGTQRASTGWRW